MALRTYEHPVGYEGIGVGRYLDLKILVASPTRVVAKVSPRPKTLLRLEMAISMCCLAPCLRSERSVAKRMPTSAKRVELARAQRIARARPFRWGSGCAALRTSCMLRLSQRRADRWRLRTPSLHRTAEGRAELMAQPVAYFCARLCLWG